MMRTRLPMLVAVLLCLAVGGLIYWQVTPLFQVDTSEQAVSQAAVNPLPATKTKRTHNIASFKLFGDSRVITAPVVVEEKELPKTRLKLTLTGVLVSPSEPGAGALIVGPDNQTGHYKINDELPGGATLKQVFADRVVVERSGQLENLFFVETRANNFQAFVPQELPEDDEYTGMNEPTANSQPVNVSSPGNIINQNVKNRLSKLKKRLMKKN